jgi:hypothetical protein
MSEKPASEQLLDGKTGQPIDEEQQRVFSHGWGLLFNAYMDAAFRRKGGQPCQRQKSTAPMPVR